MALEACPQGALLAVGKHLVAAIAEPSCCVEQECVRNASSAGLPGSAVCASNDYTCTGVADTFHGVELVITVGAISSGVHAGVAVVVSRPARLALAAVQEVLLRSALQAMALQIAGLAVGQVDALEALLQRTVEVVVVQAATAAIL